MLFENITPIFKTILYKEKKKLILICGYLSHESQNFVLQMFIKWIYKVDFGIFGLKYTSICFEFND